MSSSSSSSSSSSADDSRPYDLVLWGATGFTGGLIVQYVATKVRKARELAKAGDLSGSFRSDLALRWAIGGRSRSKLEQTRRSLGEDFDNDANVGILVADTGNVESIDALTRSTKVILSTVGPFLLYGRPLVESCVRNGTHYVDITGETPFVKSMIDDFHDVCKEKKIIMVPMSGFDSQPSDLGTFMVVDHIRRKYNCGTKNVRNFCEFQGGGSGGTIASIINLVTSTSLKDFRDPFVLNPKNARPALTASDNDQMFPSYDNKSKTWTTPFLMAGANTRVVRRSQALLGEKAPYGEDFHYQETQKSEGAGEAYIMAVFLLIFGIAISFSLTRWLLQKGLPKPGEGPDEKEREKSWFKMTFVADAENGTTVRGLVKGGDPGYGETSKMAAEAAICLALQRSDLPEGGILTPASAFGLLLIDRLREAGLTFEVTEQD